MSNNLNIGLTDRFDTIDTNLAVVDTVVDAIRAVDVPALTADIADVDTVVDAVKVTTDKLDSRIPDKGLLYTMDAVNGMNVTETEDLLHSSDAEVTTVLNVYTKKKEITVPFTGTYRVKFDMKAGYAGDTVMAKIYLGGVAHGIEQTTISDTYVTKSEDLAFTAGDLLQLYIADAVAARGCFACNLRIYGEVLYGFIDQTV